MRVRQRDRSAPGPDSPWNEIIHNLWMGGHIYRTTSGALEPAVVRDQFAVVVSLCAIDGHGPAAGVEHHTAEIPDDALSADQLAVVASAVDVVLDALRDGQRTLVRCHAGYNRSGLVVAQALIELGYDAETAINIIRERRSPFALHNEVFVDYLTAGLDVARLLTGLDAPA